jgi:hypothetical protein
LQKVDPASRTIQAAQGDPSDGYEPVLHDLQVETTAAIVIDGKDATLADLKIGACVNLEVVRGAAGKLRAVRIETVGHEFGGIVQALTADTLTIRSKSQADGAIVVKKYDLQRAAWVKVNGKKAKLGDLKVKMKVALRVSTGKPVVVGVIAAGPKVVGVVKAVNADRRTLSFGIPETPLSADDITVARNAAVVIDGKTGTLTDLRAGMLVTVQMSAETEESFVVRITSGKR